MPTHRLTSRDFVLIALYALTLLLIFNGGEKWVLTRHEVLAAEPAREMLHLGNWIIPTIGDVPRYNKPPTTGWFIAASMFVFRTESEWAVRLPSALAAVAAAMVMAAMAARYLGRQAGIIAGLMQATFFYTLMQARLAEADMLLGFASAAALYAFAMGNIDAPATPRSPSRWPAVAFYAAAGFAFLLKGFVGPIIILGGAMLYWVWSRDRRVGRFLANPYGLSLLALLVIAWPLAAYLQDHRIYQYWVREQFGRFRGDIKQTTSTGEDAREPVFFYLYWIPALLLPWVFYLIPVFVRARQLKLLTAPLAKLLISWVIPGLILLSAVAFKAKHYAIPLLPPFTLATASGLLAFISFREQEAKKRTLLLATIWTLALAGATFGVWRFVKIAPAQTAVLPALILLGGLAYMYFEARARRAAQLASLFTTAWLFAIALQVLVMPRHDLYRPSADFARRANATIPADQPIYLLGLGESHISFYTRLPFRRLDDPAAITALLSSPTPPEYVIAKAGLMPQITAALGYPPAVIDQSPKISAGDTNADRPLLLKLNPTSARPHPPKPAGDH